MALTTSEADHQAHEYGLRKDQQAVCVVGRIAYKSGVSKRPGMRLCSALVMTRSIDDETYESHQ
jgi:hypothetical protein